MVIDIDEVTGRATQGRTLPYICRGQGGRVFFVKGRSLPRRDLVCELVSATLASGLGLNVPPFGLAHIPEEIAAMGPWLKDLGSGMAFASERVNATELLIDQRPLVPFETRRLLVAFDWWVGNMDRSLTERGGNPNLLWKPTGRDAGELVVIDHNLAFDVEFDAEAFLDTHVFAADFKALVGDYIYRDAVRELFIGVRPMLEHVFLELPPAWNFADPEETVAAAWDKDQFRAMLERCCDDELWNLDL